MPTYSSSQRAQINQFCNFTQAKESIAAKFLKQQDWNLERALDSFYGTGTNASPLAASLGAIFDKYSSSTNKDLMQIEEDEDRGTARYIRDVGVSFEEPALTALHELLGSTSVGEFERDAFISGWTSASATSSKILDTISKQANHMSILRNKLASDPAFFKTTYRATFKFGTQEGQRNVAIETATDFWRQFFTASSGGIDWVTPTSPETPWLDLWLEYTTNKHKRPVNKDLWNMVGELCLKSIEPGAEKLEWWNEDGAWPMAIDEFMTWVQTQRPELGKKSGDANNATATNDEMDTS